MGGEEEEGREIELSNRVGKREGKSEEEETVTIV